MHLQSLLLFLHLSLLCSVSCPFPSASRTTPFCMAIQVSEFCQTDASLVFVVYWLHKWSCGPIHLERHVDPCGDLVHVTSTLQILDRMCELSSTSVLSCFIHVPIFPLQHNNILSSLLFVRSSLRASFPLNFSSFSAPLAVCLVDARFSFLVPSEMSPTTL